MAVSFRVMVLGALLVVPKFAAAQEPSPETLKRYQDANKSLVAPGNLTLGLIPGLPAEGDKQTNSLKSQSIQFILEGNAKDKTGTVNVGWKDGQGQFMLTVSGPLDSSGDTEPISLLGLPAGATVKLSANRLMWRAPTNQDRNALLQLCKDHQIELDDCQDQKLEKIPNTDGVRRQLRKLGHLNDTVWLFGGDLSVEHTKFSYLTKDTLTSASESDNTVSGSGRVGFFVQDLGAVFGSYTYKHAYRPGGSATQVCQPLGTTGSLRCDQAVIGKPTATSLSVASVELRSFVLPKAAINPSLQYDFKNRTTAVDVPIYFIQSSGGTPTGGVRVGWESDTKAVTVSLFVGGAFSLFQ